MIERVLYLFDAPLTIHLVMDAKMNPRSRLVSFLKKNIKSGRIETVFHGLTHASSRKGWPLLAFYHRYQAEYTIDGDEIRRGAKREYRLLSKFSGANVGICPACWLSTKTNRELFRSFKPRFIESMFTLVYGNRRIFSPLVSLGHEQRFPLFFLKLFAMSMYLISFLVKHSHIRLVIHPCDLVTKGSLPFFCYMFDKIRSRNTIPVRLQDLL
jgi:hypothetical protein